jgi:hypothetical protein
MKELKCYCAKEREEQMDRILDQSADLFTSGECTGASIVLARNLLIELLNSSDPLMLVSTIAALDKAREFNAAYALHRLIESLEGRRTDLFFQNLQCISERIQEVELDMEDEAALVHSHESTQANSNNENTLAAITSLILDSHRPETTQKAWEDRNLVIEKSVTDTWNEMRPSSNIQKAKDEF